jgi:beta-glucosidase
MSRELRGPVDAWMTLNEPLVLGLHRPRNGRHAPGLTDARYGVEAMHHLLLAHGLGDDRAARADDAPQWASSPTSAGDRGHSKAPPTAAPPSARAASTNHWILDPLLKGAIPRRCSNCGRVPSHRPRRRHGPSPCPLDFLGINYYFRQREERRRHGFVVPLEGVERTQMGWEVLPDGLRDLLIEFKQRYANLPPIYITENGMASDDAGDRRPRATIRSAIALLQQPPRGRRQAMRQGVDVRGYFAGR